MATDEQPKQGARKPGEVQQPQGQGDLQPLGKGKASRKADQAQKLKKKTMNYYAPS